MAAETARMSLEDEVDQNTAKAIAAAAEANGGSHPATEPAAAVGRVRDRPGHPDRGARGHRARHRAPGTGLLERGLLERGRVRPPRSRAPRSRPAVPEPARRLSAGPSPGQAAVAVRSSIIDTEDHTDGIRLMPGADN